MCPRYIELGSKGVLAQMQINSLGNRNKNPSVHYRVLFEGRTTVYDFRVSDAACRIAFYHPFPLSSISPCPPSAALDSRG